MRWTYQKKNFISIIDIKENGFEWFGIANAGSFSPQRKKFSISVPKSFPDHSNPPFHEV